MDKLIYNQNLYIDKESKLYNEIITNDYFFKETSRDNKIMRSSIVDNLEIFDIGIINISKKMKFKETNPEEYRKLYGNLNESSDEEDIDKNTNLIYSRIKINAFILCRVFTLKEEKALEILSVCSTRESKGMGADFINYILDYCLENEIKYTTLETWHFYLVPYFEKFGFFVVNTENQVGECWDTNPDNKFDMRRINF